MLAAAATVGLVGCDPAGSGSGTPPVVAAPIDDASASTDLTVPAAQQLYLELAAPGNDALDRWLDAGPVTQDNLDMHTSLAGQAADAWEQFAAGLRAHNWPTAAEPYTLQLATDLDARARGFRGLARARSVEAYRRAGQGVALSSDAAGQIRLALGLQPGATFCLCQGSPT
jgi:hypothetical protein